MRLLTILHRLLFATLVLAVVPCAAQKTILWKIQKEGSTRISYLMGTMHQMGNSFTDSLPVLKSKLLQSDLAIFESIGGSETVINTINQRPASDDIERAFSKKEFEALKAVAADWKADLYKLHPMETMAKLQQEYFKKHCGNVLPTDSWDHLDNYLIYLARTNGIKLYGFETDSMQAAIINSVSDNNWSSFKRVINQWVRYHDHPKKSDNECDDARAYRAFNINYALSMTCEHDLLIQQRNERWLQQLPQLLDANNCFIAVGLFHLFRECGLIQELRKQGYKVEPVILR